MAAPKNHPPTPPQDYRSQLSIEKFKLEKATRGGQGGKLESGGRSLSPAPLAGEWEPVGGASGTRKATFAYTSLRRAGTRCASAPTVKWTRDSRSPVVALSIRAKMSMEVSSMPPMPLDFSVGVRGGGNGGPAAARSSSQCSPVQAPALLTRVGSPRPPGSSAFRVVTPKGNGEDLFLCLFMSGNSGCCVFGSMSGVCGFVLIFSFGMNCRSKAVRFEDLFCTSLFSFVKILNGIFVTMCLWKLKCNFFVTIICSINCFAHFERMLNDLKNLIFHYKNYLGTIKIFFRWKKCIFSYKLNACVIEI